MRAVLRDPQLVEQLVEVPTIVSWSLLQFIMEQNADIPVPGRGGRIAGLRGFLPGQSSTSLPGPQERLSERSRTLISPSVEASKIFFVGQSSSSSSHVPARVSGALDEPGEGFFFAHFSQIKKKSAKQELALESESARQCQLIHAGSSALSSSL